LSQSSAPTEWHAERFGHGIGRRRLRRIELFKMQWDLSNQNFAPPSPFGFPACGENANAIGWLVAA
jgi:hypothetical protein